MLDALRVHWQQSDEAAMVVSVFRRYYYYTCVMTSNDKRARFLMLASTRARALAFGPHNVFDIGMKNERTNKKGPRMCVCYVRHTIAFSIRMLSMCLCSRYFVRAFHVYKCLYIYTRLVPKVTDLLELGNRRWHYYSLM